VLYLDEDVAAVLAPMLTARGYPATTTLESGRTGASDREQLLFATERGWPLVTHNRADFARLAQSLATERRHHAGMILCVRRPPRELADRISAALHAHGAAPLQDVVLYA